MKKQILFIHGGGDDSDEAYKADGIPADSLRECLGNEYAVNFPKMKEEYSPDFGCPRKGY